MRLILAALVALLARAAPVAAKTVDHDLPDNRILVRMANQAIRVGAR
jgi:hypothetical protein